MSLSKIGDGCMSYRVFSQRFHIPGLALKRALGLRRAFEIALLSEKQISYLGLGYHVALDLRSLSKCPLFLLTWISIPL